VKHINISYLSLLIFALIFLEGCATHPSPKPLAHEGKSLGDEEKKVTPKTKSSKHTTKMLRRSKSKEAINHELRKLQKNKVMPYKIGSGDRFNISIYGEPELTIKDGVVKPDGTLTISMVGDVKVSGMSINKAMDKISSKLQEYMQKPIVSLIP